MTLCFNQTTILNENISAWTRMARAKSVIKSLKEGLVNSQQNENDIHDSGRFNLQKYHI